MAMTVAGRRQLHAFISQQRRRGNLPRDTDVAGTVAAFADRQSQAVPTTEREKIITEASSDWDDTSEGGRMGHSRQAWVNVALDDERMEKANWGECTKFQLVECS